MWFVTLIICTVNFLIPAGSSEFNYITEIMSFLALLSNFFLHLHCQQVNKFCFQTRTRHQSNSLFDLQFPLGYVGFAVSKQPHTLFFITGRNGSGILAKNWSTEEYLSTKNKTIIG